MKKATDMGGYWSEYVYALGYLSKIRSPNPANPVQIRTWGFKIEPSDNTATSDPYPAPEAEMGKTYRITITDPSGHPEEYFYDGANTWYVSPRDYVLYTDQTTNNLTQAPKTYYLYDRKLTQRAPCEGDHPGARDNQLHL